MVNKKPLVVYWSIVTGSESRTRLNLMWGPPVPLMKLLHEGIDIKTSEYMRCSGLKNSIANTYALVHPTDSTVTLRPTLDGNLEVIDYKGFPAWTPMSSSAFSNQHRVIYDFSWAFFSEEPVVLQQTPPYLHNTVTQEGGVLSTGSFDISRWFRVLNLDYILWKGSDTLSVKEGEPAAYYTFQTDRRIILKQFEMTDELLSMSRQVVEHKNFFSHESLSTLYDRFTGSNRHKRVLKLIKDNLLD